MMEEERKAFYAYNRAQRGDDGVSRYARVSPKRVRVARNAWLKALGARQEECERIAQTLGIKAASVIVRYYMENGDEDRRVKR